MTFHTINSATLATSLFKQLSNLTVDATEGQISMFISDIFIDADALDYDEIKKKTGELHKKLKDAELEGFLLTRTQMLDVIAKALGFENHHSLKSAKPNTSPEKSASSSPSANLSKFKSYNDILKFQGGAVTVIVGSNGAGKSLLIATQRKEIDTKDTILFDTSGAHSPKSITITKRALIRKYPDYANRLQVGLANANIINFPDNVHSGIITAIESGKYKTVIFDSTEEVIRKSPSLIYKSITSDTHVILLTQSEDIMARLEEWGLRLSPLENTTPFHLLSDGGYGQLCEEITNLGKLKFHRGHVGENGLIPKVQKTSTHTIASKNQAEWSKFAPETFVAIVGQTGSGKTFEVANNGRFLDDDSTMVLDYGQNYRSDILIEAGKSMGTDFGGWYGFKKATYQDFGKTPAMKTIPDHVKRVFVDEYMLCQHVLKKELDDFVQREGVQLIITLQNEKDLWDLNINPANAIKGENIFGKGPIIAYTFNMSGLKIVHN